MKKTTCVVYAAVYGKTPAGLNYVPPGTAADQASFLQTVAWQTVQDYRAGRI